MQKIKIFFSNNLGHIASIGLFILLPLFVVLSLGENVILSEQQKYISKVSSNIDNSLIDIENEVSPASFLIKVARGAWFTLKQNEKDLNQFWEYEKKLKTFLKSDLDLYIFNDKGDLITPQNINLKSRFLLSKLWNNIEADYDEKVKNTIRYKKAYSNLFGTEFKLGLFLESRNQLLPIMINNKAGYIYWMNFPEKPKMGLVTIFWDIPSFNLRLNQCIKRYSESLDCLFIRDTKENKNQIIKNKREIPLTDFDDIFVKTAVLDSNDVFIDKNDLLWRFLKLDDYSLLASLKSNKSKFYTFITALRISFFFATLILIFIYSRIIKQQISIRTKLITLFMIAVFTPVMGFSYLGYRYISNLRNNIITNIGNESRKILLNIITELESSGSLFINDFRKIADDFKKYDKNTVTNSSFDKSFFNKGLSLIERRSVANASLYSQFVNKLLLDDINIVMENFAKFCIDSSIGSKLFNSTDPVIKKGLETPETAFTSYVTKPDHVHNFLLGNLDFYLYWSIYDNDKNEKEYLVILRQTNSILPKILKKRLDNCKYNPIENKYKIYACYNKNNNWFPDNYIGNKLNTISRRIINTGKPVETEINLNSKRYILIGIKSGKLKDYSFYALYPYEKINEELNKKTFYIIALIFLFVFVALAIGFRLSKYFILPVYKLEKGIEEIKKRNNDYRIEKLQNDEFGILAENFNKMISNLKEMELAKYIQEDLLPKSIPQIEGYEIACKNEMASAIGGDYYDVFLLDKDNLCIVIGDVSGHGVASAIVMAMAKSILYQGFKETRNLNELFTDLNSVINTYFSKKPTKKMITLFATIINIPTGNSVFIDAGHNFPIKISKDGIIEDLKMVGYPVGSMKKLKIRDEIKYTISEGDTIVFYTDGIIEANGKSNEQYGYDRFKESLTLMMKERAENILNKLFDNYSKWKEGTEADDDVTLVVLKRLSS